MNTVLLILCIILAAVAVAQGIRAEVYKRRAEEAEKTLSYVAAKVTELRVWVENNIGKGAGNKTDGTE